VQEAQNFQIGYLKTYINKNIKKIVQIAYLTFGNSRISITKKVKNKTKLPYNVVGSSRETK
jgi:predicted nucleic acid-binding protein